MKRYTHSNPSYCLLRPASQNSYPAGTSHSAAVGGQPRSDPSSLLWRVSSIISILPSAEKSAISVCLITYAKVSAGDVSHRAYRRDWLVSSTYPRHSILQGHAPNDKTHAQMMLFYSIYSNYRCIQNNGAVPDTGRFG